MRRPCRSYTGKSPRTSPHDPSRATRRPHRGTGSLPAGLLSPPGGARRGRTPATARPGPARCGSAAHAPPARPPCRGRLPAVSAGLPAPGAGPVAVERGSRLLVGSLTRRGPGACRLRLRGCRFKRARCKQDTPSPSGEG